MKRIRVTAGLVSAFLLVATAGRAADQQVRPFVGTTFAGSSTFVDLSKEDAPGNAHVTFGANWALLGDILGVDADFGHTPGFFEGSDANLVLKSSVTTLTGNVVVAAPRRLTEYSLRLYFVAGGGIMHLRREDSLGVFDIAETVPAMDVGVGALGFLTGKVGLAWEVRRFQRVGGPPPLSGISIGPERLSFWRAHMALVMRY